MGNAATAKKGNELESGKSAFRELHVSRLGEKINTFKNGISPKTFSTPPLAASQLERCAKSHFASAGPVRPSPQSVPLQNTRLLCDTETRRAVVGFLSIK